MAIGHSRPSFHGTYYPTLTFNVDTVAENARTFMRGGKTPTPLAPLDTSSGRKSNFASILQETDEPNIELRSKFVKKDASVIQMRFKFKSEYH